MQETATEKYRRRLVELDEEFDSEGYKSHMKELADYFLPRRGRYLVSDQGKIQDGVKKHQKIINGSSSDAIRILAAGMQGGLTSPSRPWFRLNTSDPDMTEYGPAKWWLSLVRDLMLERLQRSNFYPSTHYLYSEVPVFSTGCMMIEEDFKTVIRCRPFTIGEYRIGVNDQYRVDTLYTRAAFTVKQLVEKFGIENVSDAVKNLWEKGTYQRTFEVVRAIQPNALRTAGTMTARGKKLESVYYEVAGDQDKVLRRAGYDSIPFVAPRWEVAGVSTYGNDCPGMTALGDCKMLQKMEEKKLKKIDKHTDPPMNAPSAMKGKGGTIISGGVNYIDVSQGQQSFTPVYQTDANIGDIATEIDRVERRIRSMFFNDLFLAVLNEEKKMTATEVAKRYEEKMVVLGPVIEQLQSEMLDVLLDRTYQIMWNFGLIPSPPPEMAGMPLKIEYIGLLSQAQKMVGTASIEQVATFVGGIAAINPEAVDKFDADQAIDVYSDAVGVAPMIIRSDDKVAQIRAARAKQQQMAQSAQLAQVGAKAAKDLGDAKVGQSSALEALMGGMAG